MSLREQVLQDNQTVFFNPFEFGSTIHINGKKVQALEDTEQLVAYRATGLCKGERLLYLPADTFARLPRTGDRVLLEDETRSRQWYVERCGDVDGLLELVLSSGA